MRRFAMASLLILLLSGSAEPANLIDAFEYPQTNVAQDVWDVQGERGNTPALSMVEDGGRLVMQIEAPFASDPNLSRIYIDRQVDLDLAAAGGFSLEVLSSNPEATGSMSLYFHSREGWYSGSADIASKGWGAVPFSKASFRLEDQPIGWNKIDAIRIAFWRGKNTDFFLRLRKLEATQHNVALIIPAVERREAGSLKMATDVAEMLDAIGLGNDAIEDSSLASGGLGDRSIAILPYNPKLTSEAVEALIEFVAKGGKVLACYQLPDKLAQSLGFGELKYRSQQNKGDFAEIRFHATDIASLPPSVRQASWNITTAKPVGYNAKVVGQWYDRDGQSADAAAMLVSDRGAFFSHVLLRDDWNAKKQMLASIMGHLSPMMWKQMAEAALKDLNTLGHLDSLEALTEFLKKNDQHGVDLATRSGLVKLQEAKQQFTSGHYEQVVGLAKEVHQDLALAYVKAQPSPTTEGRAFWNHTGTGAYDGDWNRTASELSAAGFNMILPNMLWGGVAHYPSKLLPHSRTFNKYGDQIEQCVAAAREHKLEVHVWKVNWNLSTAPQDFVKQIHAEHRNQVTVTGEAEDWLCPSHPDNFQLELQSMLEVARDYPIDGLHFDYIRYPGRDKCYCDGCRERFEAASGKPVEEWPSDCYSGQRSEEYLQWRCDQITRLVKAVHDQAKTIRPGIRISAAVFGAYPECRSSVAQDWPEWIKAGYLDFVCPMDYTQSDLSFIGLVSNQLKLVNGRIPIYPGIGQWRLPNDRVVGQIYHARALGAAGFTIFDLSHGSAETFVPTVGLGVGRNPALPPHRNR
ncbi:glycoside hydrolase family 10 protein [Novipirellula artificiosorum]|nr:family 10 glycosylhydrolase [Novipirellula artificiosorum]